MKAITCPHCGSDRIAAGHAPKDVVVVLPCPNCSELVVLFRNKAIALKRAIIENGTFEERKAHIAEIIAEFIDPSMFTGNIERDLSQGKAPFGLPLAEPDAAADSDEDTPPISQEEMDQFVQAELKLLDNPVYFRKHFG